ncbi:MAG TPA: OmpA family protein [Solirubrobacteraceae bacterium]|nr:OmpA family protein [Solirubrobacteraceae bacterium]
MVGAVVLAAAVPTAAAAAAATIVPLSGRVEPVSGVVREQFSRVEVAETEVATTYAVPADVLFAFDSARVTARGRRALRRLDVRGPVTVVGHTDARGAAAYNLRLSRRRAAAVTRALGGGTDVTVRARGEAEPVASNARAAGRARNRRVELIVPRP